MGGHSRSIRLLLCDLDGTLIDTMGAFADLAAEVMRAQHGDDLAWARRRYLETSGIPFEQQLEQIHPGVANEIAIAEFERRKAAVCRAARLSESNRSALHQFRSAGIAVGISSSTAQRHVDEFVARSDFPFAVAFGSRNAFVKGKPHVAEACRHLGVERDEMVFVGDSTTDLAAAAAAGVRFFGLLGTLGLDRFLAEDPRCETVDSFAQVFERIHQDRTWRCELTG